MKKTISLLLCCVMLFSLCACGAAGALNKSIAEARGKEGFGRGSKLIHTDPAYKKFDDKYVPSDYAAKSAEEVGAFVVTKTAGKKIEVQLVDAFDGTIICSGKLEKDTIRFWITREWDEYLLTHNINIELSTGAEFGHGSGLLVKITDSDGGVRWHMLESDTLNVSTIADSVGYVDVHFDYGRQTRISIVLGDYAFRAGLLEWVSIYDCDEEIAQWVADEFDNAMEDYEFTKALSGFSGSAKEPASYKEALNCLIHYDETEGIYYKSADSDYESFLADKPENVRAFITDDDKIVDFYTGETLIERNGSKRIWNMGDAWKEYVYDDYLRKMIAGGKCTGEGLAFYDTEKDLYLRKSTFASFDYSNVDADKVGMVVEFSSTFNESSCSYYSNSTGVVEVFFDQETLKLNLVDLSTGRSFASRTYTVTGYPDTLYGTGRRTQYAKDEFDIDGWIDAQYTSHLAYR